MHNIISIIGYIHEKKYLKYKGEMILKIIVFLAEGFEEVEALTVVDYLRRMDIKVDTVSITKEKEVRGSHNIMVLADMIIEEIKDIESYYGVIIPGGLPGATNLMDNNKVINIIKSIYENEKLIAAICAGPIVLKRAGVITNRNITSYPGFEGQLEGSMYKEDNVVVDLNIITARGPFFAVDFAIEIVKYLLGEEKSKELKKDILYRE